MGLFKLFVEEIPEEKNYGEAYSSYVSEEELDVNTDVVSQDNLIQDVYKSNNMSDLSTSIFKVEELINSLPKEMPNETKKVTVLSILSSFGLTIEKVIEDGQSRLEIVNAACKKIKSENENVIVSNNDKIEQKKLEIQELEKDNSNRLLIISDTEDKVEAETKRIEQLIKFVGGNA